MSDFGFDTVALAGGDAAAPSHPLKIARELIARGQARHALDLLSEHHDQLADESEYLLVCSEAWLAEGDALRAQQALLGAARLAPDDPTPLVLLAELLQQEGEVEKAEMLLAKAEALGDSPRASIAEDAPLEAPEYDDDLIAVAEQQERRSRAFLSPKQTAIAVSALVGISLLIIGISKLTETDGIDGAASPAETIDPPAPSADPEREPLVAAVPAPVAPPTEESDIEPVTGPATDPVGEPAAVEVVERATAEAVAVEPVEPLRPIEPTLPEVPEVAAAPPKRSSQKTTRPKLKPAPEALVPLTSSDPRALTEQGDRLHATGQTGLAASYFRRALELDSDYAPALVGMGRSILRAEKYDEAFRNATRALELARGVDSRLGLEAEAIYQLGRVHLSRGDLDAARRLFRQSSSLPGAPTEAWFYLGEALWNDNSPAARTAYERYLGLVSSGPLAERARRAIQ